jgi:hypothetical protein
MGIKVLEFKTEYRIGKDPVDWVSYTGSDSFTEAGNVSSATWERVEKMRPPEYLENDNDGLKLAALRHLWAAIGPAYETWKNGEVMPETGTPLAAWGGVNAGQIEALKTIQIRTVEELAEMSDSNMKMILPNIRELRNMARQWIERRPEHERDAKFKELEERNAAMAAMLEELMAAKEDDKPRRGRPPKAEAA